MISIIAAMDSKRGIGKNGSIPWHIPEDFKHFKEITMGHPMIMGRRTFESLGRLLPGRAHIVITRDLENKTEVEGLVWTDSLESAIELAKEIENKATPLRSDSAKASTDKQSSEGQSEVFIIGGGEIYKQAIEEGVVDKMYLTIVDGDFEADTFFPKHDGFLEKENKEFNTVKNKFSFKILEKE